MIRSSRPRRNVGDPGTEAPPDSVVAGSVFSPTLMEHGSRRQAKLFFRADAEASKAEFPVP